MTDLLKNKREGWVDSIALWHELDWCEVPIYDSEETCRAKNPCIEKSEKEPSQYGYNCKAVRVYVLDADEVDTWLNTAAPSAK